MSRSTKIAFHNRDKYIALGLNIAYYRKRQGMTQEQLAEKPESAVPIWERSGHLTWCPPCRWRCCSTSPPRCRSRNTSCWSSGTDSRQTNKPASPPEITPGAMSYGYVRSEPLPILTQGIRRRGYRNRNPNRRRAPRPLPGRPGLSGTNLEIPVGKAAASAQKEDGRRDQDDGQPREAAGFPLCRPGGLSCRRARYPWRCYRPRRWRNPAGRRHRKGGSRPGR